MTRFQKKFIACYKEFYESGIIPTLGQLAEKFYGNNVLNNKNKVSQIITTISKNKEWPVNNGEVEIAREHTTEIPNNIGAETVALLDCIRQLENLNTKEIKRVFNIIKNNKLSKAEVTVLMRIHKRFEIINEEAKDRILRYVEEKFNL